MSLSAFLERVEELRLARQTSESELFNSAIDLFEGKALIWYRAINKSVVTWSSLVQKLREEFQPPDYNDRLFEELKRRTQGPDESIGIYVAIMNTLFSRLTIKVSEKVKLKILRNNISPFYQTQLALIDINSIDDLIKYGRVLEARKSVVESFVSPTKKTCNLLEPDLAYIQVNDTNLNEINIPGPSGERKITMKCFNCDRVGHRAIHCRQPHRKRCYKCNRPNVTVRTCPTCNKPSGNEEMRR